jgi:hypothetical protein
MMKKLFIIFICVLGISGCQSGSVSIHLTEKEADLYESVLRLTYSKWKDNTRSHYLTYMRPEEWFFVNVRDFPDSFYRRLSDMPIHFKKATKAVYSNDYFKDPKTGKPACMIWITINRWISDTEAEVEGGSSEYLGGSILKAIYIKENGKWKMKQLIFGGIS